MATREDWKLGANGCRGASWSDFSLQKKKKMLNKWRTINSLVHKIRLYGRRGKGTTEPYWREKLRQAPQKEGGEILCDFPSV